MALEYIKHNRPVTPHDMGKYGRLADHDIVVPCLLLYELGKIRDKNGIEETIDKEFLNHIMEETNSYLKKRHLLPFSKIITQFAQPVEEANAIPLIKNHKTDQVENQVGWSRGLLYTEYVDNVLSLFTKVVITDPEAKKDVENGLLRQISIGTRPAGSRPVGSIKEISFVVNEAAPLCGLMFSEEEKKSNSEVKQLEPVINAIETNISIQMSEEMSALQFAEHDLDSRIIPNHIIVSRMIKNGKAMPFNYDELLTQETKVLEFMERNTPARELGIMLGTNRKPEHINLEELQDKKLDEMIKASQKKLKIKSNIKDKDSEQSPKMIELIRQNQSHTELRQKEFKHILELAEHSPTLAVKYIKCELGENVEAPKYKDTLLSEYLGELKEIKSKIKQLQLGEN